MSSEESAAHPLRFDCPACGVLLTVPAAAAGIQGPCPRCWQEIISPDPARGLPPMLPAVQVIPQPPEPEPVASEPVAIPEPAAPIPESPPVPQVQEKHEEPLPAAAATVPEPAVPSYLSPPPPPRRIGRAAAWLTSAAVFSAAGFYLGMTHRAQTTQTTAILPAAKPPSSPQPPAPEPAAPLQAEVATPQPAPTPPPPLPEPAKLDADSTLKSFLDAPDWQTRSQHVLVPDQIRDLMEKHAAQSGDGPIPVTAIVLDELQDANYLYKVRTAELPDGFPVALVATEHGPKVDWEAFVGFHDDHFRKFAEGPAGQSGIFQLLVKPDPAESEATSHFQRFRLNVPMPDREQLAWMKKDAVALAKLRAVFEGSPSLDKASVDEMVAHQGVPLVLALEKKMTNDGRAIIEIVDYIAFGWGPRRQ